MIVFSGLWLHGLEEAWFPKKAVELNKLFTHPLFLKSLSSVKMHFSCFGSRMINSGTDEFSWLDSFAQQRMGVG